MRFPTPGSTSNQHIIAFHQQEAPSHRGERRVALVPVIWSLVFLFLGTLGIRPAQAQESAFETGEEAEDTLRVRSTFDVDASEVSFQALELPDRLLGGSFTFTADYRANLPGVGYDAEVRWTKAGPTGFGLYSSLSMAEVGPNAGFDPLEGGQPQIFKNGGSILAIAGGGGRGGLWRRNTSEGGWHPLKGNLPSPYRHVAATMNPKDKDHVFVVTPSDQHMDEFLLYETTDGGNTWSEIPYFSKESNTLHDISTVDVGSASTQTTAIHFFGDGQNVFLYNFAGNSWNSASGDTWGYYSADGGKTWSRADLDVESQGKPFAQKRMYFGDDGVGLLNPTGGVIYRTTDYGKTWTEIGDYTDESYKKCDGGCEGLSFATSDDGQAIYVLFKKEESEDCCILESSSNSGEDFSRQDLSDSLPDLGPQGLVVDPDDPSRLTAFIYYHGPFVSTDGGTNWTQIYANGDVQKEVVHSHFYDTREIGEDGPSMAMAKPTDYRDVRVLDAFESDPILIGSDQGLFVMSHPKESISPVAFWNVGAGMDNTEVYTVEVDDCGNLYHGLWHHSAMIRSKSSGEKVSRDELYYYGDVNEAGGMYVKKKDVDNCLSWASVDSDKDGEYDFESYISNKSGELKRHEPVVEYEYIWRPVFFEGAWTFVHHDNWNLYSAQLNSNTKELLTKNVRWLKKDRASNSLWYLTDLVQSPEEPEDVGGTLNPKEIIRYQNRQPRKGEGVPTEIISLDLTGSSIKIAWENGYDVHNGRVIAAIKKDDETDILIYNHSDEQPVMASDIPAVENPFSEMFENPKLVDEVWVDPTDPDRYFASVENNSSSGAQCPYHLMATEDSGQTWEVFSEYLDCTKIWDVAFNPTSETMYVATHARGILQGNLGGLNDATDLSVNLSCEDDEISSTGTVDCALNFKIDGPIKESWARATNSIQVDIEFPLDGFLYELHTSDQMLRTAGCTKEYKEEQGFRKLEKLTCRSTLDHRSQLADLPLRLQMNRMHSSHSSSTATLSAELSVNTAPQDLLHRNDTSAASFTVHSKTGYESDQYDPHFSERENRVVSNDEIGSPAELGSSSWIHHRQAHHMACVGGSDQHCGSVLTDPSSDAPRAAKEVWTARIRPLSLPSSGDEDYYKIPLPKFDSGAMEALENPECGTSTVNMTRAAGGPQTESKDEKDPDAPSTGYAMSVLFNLEKATYLPYFENAKPEGYTLRKVHAEVDAAFSRNNSILSDRARISTLQGVAWEDARTWKIIDDGGTYFVEPDEGALKVYSGIPENADSRTERTVEREVETFGRLKITVEPIANKLAPTGLNPALVQLSGYQGDNPDSQVAFGTTLTEQEKVSMTIDCPKSMENISDMIISVGENDLTTGGYTLNLEYRVHVRRQGKGTKPVDAMIWEDSTAAAPTSTEESSPGEDGTSDSTEDADPEDLSAETPDNVTLTLMPRGGLFLSGVSSFEDISSEAGSALGGEESVLTLGGSMAFGSRDGPVNLRITGLRTTGSLVSTTEGTTSPTDFGRENILAFTGDLVVRPLPRLLIQPYAIGGLGTRRISVKQLEEVASNTRWDLAAQIGLGADLRLGNVTLGMEVVDYLTGLTSSNSGIQHDAFLFITLGVPVF